MTDSPSYLELAQKNSDKAKSLLPVSKFTRYGQSLQLTINSAADLPEVLELDEALWAATAAPTSSFECSAAFLNHIDAKGAGRIRVAEVKTAVRWLLNHVEPSEIRADNTELNLEALLEDGKDSAAIRTVSGKLLRRFKAEKISLKLVQQVLAETHENGPKMAGGVAAEDIVSADTNGDQAESEALTLVDLINDILLATNAGQTPPKHAVTQSDTEQFFIQAEQVQKWRQSGESIVRPLGDNSAAAVSLYNELKPKIDEYFQLCAATALDPTLNERWQLPVPGSDDFSKRLAAAPLARPAAGASLPITGAVNPLYAEKLAKFGEKALLPLYDNTSELTAERWQALEKLLASYREWYSGRPAVGAIKIPAERLKQWVGDKSYREALEKKLTESRKALVDIRNLQAAEKLLLFQSQLLKFVNSFVSFPDLYDPNDSALFEMGTLIMDGRRFTLAVKLTDRAQHVKFSTDSNMFVLYVEVTTDDEKPIYELAVPVTSGTRGNLQLGKRGIFHDRHGSEYHARVVQQVEKPVSLQEAIFAPFKALGKAVTGKIEGLADNARDKLLKSGTKAVDNIAAAPGATTANTTTPAPATAPAASGGNSGFLAGGGIAIAALASSAAFITKTLANLSLLKVVSGILTAAALVVVPVAILAWIRLRQRDLSSILEGSGWAINARMRLTRIQANNFTIRPTAGLLNSQASRLRSLWHWLGLLAIFAAIGLYVALQNEWLPPIAEWF